MTMTLKHAPHFHSKNSIFCCKFTNHTILPSSITPALSNTTPNLSMIAELFPIEPRNIMLGINDDAASASSINLEWNLRTNQVTEVSDSSTKNLGNEFFAINNLVEVQTLQHAISLEKAFAILDSNRQDEDQHFVEGINVDKDALINQVDTRNNITIEFNVNLNNNNIENALNIVNIVYYVIEQ